MVDMILNEMAKFAENELAPINEVADREGCKQLGPNEVKTPSGFKELIITSWKADGKGCLFRKSMAVKACRSRWG